MRKTLSAGALLAVGLLTAGWVLAGQPEKKDQPAPGESFAAPEAKLDFRQTKEWKALNRYVGTWDYEVLVRIPQPDAARGSVTAAWTLGGRFLQTNSKADDDSELMVLMTYDPNRRVFRDWSFTSAGHASAYTGSWDEATRTFNFKANDPVSSTWTDRFIDDDHREYTVIVRDPDGKIVYERLGKATRRKMAAEKPAPDPGAANVPPKTAPDTVKKVFELLMAGDVDAAAKYFDTAGNKNVAEVLKRRADELKRGEIALALAGSKEDGDLAVVIVTLVDTDKGQGDAAYDLTPMTRRDGMWQIHESIREMKLEGAAKERMDALWTWAQGRREELDKALRTPKSIKPAPPDKAAVMSATQPGAADAPPKTAADTANRIVALLKAGDVAAAAKYFVPLPGDDMTEGLKRAADDLKKGQITSTLAESKEDGDLAVMIWKVVEKGHGEGATYQPSPMIRKDGVWRICLISVKEEVRRDGAGRTDPPSADTMQLDVETMKLDAEGQKRMEALWKWGMERCKELNDRRKDGKDFEKPPAPDAERAKPDAERAKPTAERAKPAAARADIIQLRVALDVFEVDMGRYPTTQEGLSALLAPPPGSKNWKGPYLKGAAKDPWGHPYVYRCPGTHNPNGFDLHSFGPDGKEGGGDDIDNWSK